MNAPSALGSIGAENTARSSIPWYYLRRVVLPTLVLCYPLGLLLMIKSPLGGKVSKATAAVLTLPLFCFVILLTLKPYWRFAGHMRGPIDFSLDFDGLLNDPDSRLAQHRAAQAAGAGPSPASTPDKAGALTLSGFTPWTDFRGPRRDGVVRGETISLDWTAHPPRELWRQPVGGGHAAFVVAGPSPGTMNARAITIEQRRRQEAITCYDAATGRELWAYAYDAHFKETLGGPGPRATPTIHGDRVVALGAEGHLHCLDAATGKPLWGVNILKNGEVSNLAWAMSGAPLVVDGKVIVTNSGKDGPSIFAYALADGRLIWESDAGPQGYSSPTLATLCGVRQVLNLGGTELRGIDPDNGKVLWRHPWETYMWINASQPLVVGEDRIFLSAGYDHGCAMVRFSRDGSTWKTRELWSNRNMKNKFSSSVIRDGFAYGLDEAILCCLDLATGKRKWKGGRYNYGSLLLIDDHLLVLTENGEFVLVEANPDAHVELARVKILEGRTWNNFVLVSGRLLARNDKWMACYDLRPPPP